MGVTKQLPEQTTHIPLSQSAVFPGTATHAKKQNIGPSKDIKSLNAVGGTKSENTLKIWDFPNIFPNTCYADNLYENFYSFI